MKFSAHSRDDGSHEIRGVDIFVAHKRPAFVEVRHIPGYGGEPTEHVNPERDYGVDWIRKALANTAKIEASGWRIPLTAQYGQRRNWLIGFVHNAHEATRDDGVALIVADLVVTDADAMKLIRDGRLPFRSLCVNRPDEAPTLDEVMLLSTGKPYHKMPLLLVEREA